MNYITKQKFNIGELVDIPKSLKSVLLIIGEDALREIYSAYLQKSGFRVSASHFSDHIKIAESLPATDLLIFEIKETDGEERLEFLKIISNRFSSLSVITVGYALDEKFLQSLMGLGAIGHINRKFSRPQDLVTIAKMAFIQYLPQIPPPARSWDE